MSHPLKNGASKHYEIYDGLEGIEVIESVLNKDELIAACKFNILKYQLRLGKKGDSETVKADLKKIKTYKEYLESLVKTSLKVTDLYYLCSGSGCEISNSCFRWQGNHESLDIDIQPPKNRCHNSYENYIKM